MTVASPRALRSGFTLVELLVVVALLGLTAALVAASLGRSSAAAKQRDAVQGLVSALNAARLEAMRSQKSLEALCSVDGETGKLVLRAGDRERSWDSGGLAPTAGRFDPVADEGVRRERVASAERDELANTGVSGPVRVLFDTGGRAGTAAWRLAALEGSERSGDARPVGRTIWVLRFDPVSGSPSAEPVGARR